MDRSILYWLRCKGRLTTRQFFVATDPKCDFRHSSTADGGEPAQNFLIWPGKIYCNVTRDAMQTRNSIKDRLSACINEAMLPV